MKLAAVLEHPAFKILAPLIIAVIALTVLHNLLVDISWAGDASRYLRASLAIAVVFFAMTLNFLLFARLKVTADEKNSKDCAQTGGRRR